MLRGIWDCVLLHLLMPADCKGAATYGAATVHGGLCRLCAPPWRSRPLTSKRVFGCDKLFDNRGNRHGLGWSLQRCQTVVQDSIEQQIEVREFTSPLQPLVRDWALKGGAEFIVQYIPWPEAAASRLQRRYCPFPAGRGHDSCLVLCLLRATGPAEPAVNRAG